MRSGLVYFCAGLALVSPAVAQPAADDWVARKCATYQAAWSRALAGAGADTVSAAFIAGNNGFIAGGCVERASICPQSPVELDIANTLSIALINAGAASTFLPFACPHPDPGAGGWTGPGL